ncbi:MAG: hypothetical protein K8R99_15035 [Actinomycetia bacterium]|nr:hypothetical protein [Actinomycetes bacterium]
MVQSQLSAYSGSDPTWGFVALVASELFTGEAAVGLDPRVRLFAVEGRIYFAEREDDAPVGTRLVNCRALSANQLARGAVNAGGHESLARLFQRDATIDRDAVELTVQASTESLLASIADKPVGMPEVFPLRHHPAGLHHWLRGAPPTIPDEEVAPVADAPAPFIAVEPPMPDLTPQPASPPTVAGFPAPTVPTETAVPEWPRADDEPMWVVPADARELAPIVDGPVKSDEPVAIPVVPIESAHLPQLASLHSIQIPPAAIQPPVNPFEPVPPSASDPVLPKLAAGPMSVNDLKRELTNATAPSEPWGSSSKNMAAVQIWEMVDDIFDDGKKPDPRAGISAPQAPTKGWRRKKG